MIKNRAFWLVCCALAAFSASCSEPQVDENDPTGGTCGSLVCTPSQVCVENTCKTPCAEGTADVCVGNDIQHCENGYLTTIPCSNGCVNNACVCTTGTTQCNNGNMETCHNGTWSVTEPCANGCTADGCIPGGDNTDPGGDNTNPGDNINGCTNDADCKTNETCKDSKCHCGDVICGGRDQDISYCSATQKCVMWDSYCLSNEDCETGESCNKTTHRCIISCDDPEPEGNIVPNWSFEEWDGDRPAFWSHHDNYQQVTLIQKSEDARACNGAVQLINTTNTNGRLESELIALPESKLHPDKDNKEKYSCSLWSAGEGGTLNIGYITYNAEGKELTKKTTAGTKESISTIYREETSIEVKVETEARYIQFLLGFNETSEDGIIVDAFSCVRQSNVCDEKVCEAWEACTTAQNGKCYPLEGYCSSDTDCSNGATCDSTTHTCTWGEGKCATSKDCPGAEAGTEMCNENHECVPGDPCADVDCKKDWLECKAGACVLKEGRCWNTADCMDKNKPACYGDTHTCVDISTTYKVENASQCRVTGYNKETKECPVNIVPNGSFEAWEEVQLGSSESSRFTLPVSWYGTEFEVAYERYATEIDANAIKPYTTDVHSGAKALQVVFPKGDADRFTSEGFNVPGKSYDCYFWVRGKGDVRLHSYSSRGDQEKMDFVSIDTTEWQRQQFYIKNAATAMRLIFYISNTDAAKDHIQIDDVVCTERVF